MLTFVVGVLFGFMASLIASFLFSYDQFSSSTARYRVRKTVEATKEIIKETNRSEVRDRYRYSLGVIIDQIEQTFGGNSDFEKNEWPCLINFQPTEDKNGFQPTQDEEGKDQDRWELFNKYVRPVVEDINNSSFIGNYSLVRVLSKDARQLRVLAQLCNCIENVVCELDAAFENDLVEIVSVNRVVIRPVSNSNSKDIEQLREKCRNLNKAWVKWLHVTAIHRSF